MSSAPSCCVRKHFFYQYVQRNSYTETMKIEILEAQCLQRGFIISMAYIPEESIQCVQFGERTSGWKEYILNKKTNNWMIYWVNIINVFWPIIQPYLSRMMFLKEVFGGLVQQLPAGLWVIEGTREIQKDRTFVNMGYIFDNLFCWLLIKLLAP